MAVKTYSMELPGAKDPQPHFCEWCPGEQEADYWSQNEDGDRPLGPSVFHCHAHRAEGRFAAGTRKSNNKIIVLWGKFGQVNAQVDRVTKSGTIYAKRWNKKQGRWTTPHKIEPYKGIYRIA